MPKVSDAQLDLLLSEFSDRLLVAGVIDNDSCQRIQSWPASIGILRNTLQTLNMELVHDDHKLPALDQSSDRA